MHKVKYIHNMCRVQNKKYYLHNKTKKEYTYDPQRKKEGIINVGQHHKVSLFVIGFSFY